MCEMVVHNVAEWQESRYRERSRLELLIDSMAKAGHPMRKFVWGKVVHLLDLCAQVPSFF